LTLNLIGWTQFDSPQLRSGKGLNHLMSELTADQIQRMVKVNKKYIFFRGMFELMDFYEKWICGWDEDVYFFFWQLVNVNEFWLSGSYLFRERASTRQSSITLSSIYLGPSPARVEPAARHTHVVFETRCINTAKVSDLSNMRLVPSLFSIHTQWFKMSYKTIVFI
jgi:hypothetical protein